MKLIKGCLCLFSFLAPHIPLNAQNHFQVGPHAQNAHISVSHLEILFLTTDQADMSCYLGANFAK